MTINFEQEGKQLNWDAYLATLAQYEKPDLTFHPDTISFEVLSTIAARPSTVLADGVPVTTNIVDARELYEVERCVGLVDRIKPNVDGHNILAGLLPSPALIPHLQEFRDINPSDPTFIFTAYDAGGYGAYDLEANNGNGYVIHELEHSQGGTSASLNMFQSATHNKYTGSGTSQLHEILNTGLVKSQEINPDGSTVTALAGGNFTEKQIEELWQLFSQRFSDISDNMPVRIEEDRNSSVELFNDPRNIFTFHTDTTGIITCASLVSDDPEAYPWISAEYVEKAKQDYLTSTGKDPYMVFVPGVAAYRHQNPSISRGVLKKLVECVAATGNQEIVFQYECTDVSSNYIPKIVSKVLSNHTMVEFAGTQLLGQKKYIVLEIQPV